MLHGSTRTAVVDRATKCPYCEICKTVLQGERKDSWLSPPTACNSSVQDQYIRKSYMQHMHRMAKATAWVTPSPFSAQTIRNRLREAKLRAWKPDVRKVLPRHHWEHYAILYTLERDCFRGWASVTVFGGIGLSLLSLQAVLTLCVTEKKSSSLLVCFWKKHAVNLRLPEKSSRDRSPLPAAIFSTNETL